MLAKLIAILVVVTGAFNGTIILDLRRRARGFLRTVYLYLSLSSLLLVTQVLLWPTELPREPGPHRALLELSVLLWATASTIGMGYSLSRRPGPSPLTRALDVIVACLGVLVLLWTTAVVPTLAATSFSVIHTVGVLIVYVAISVCTGFSLALSRITSTRGRPELVANIVSSLLISLAQMLLLLNLHRVREIPLIAVQSLTLSGLVVFNVTHSTRFKRFTLRFPTRRIYESMGLVLYLPLLAFPIVAVLLDHHSFALTARNLLLSLLVVVLIARIRLFEDVAHRRREALEKRITQRTSELAAAHDLLTQIMDVAEDGMIAIDDGDHALLVNRAARRILRLPSPPTSENPALLLIDIDDGPIGAIFSAAAESQQLGQRVNREVVIGGESRHLEILIRRISDTSRRLVAVFRDVTDDVSLVQKKNHFISMVSHEIRTPLTSLSGALSLIRSGALGQMPPEASRMIDIASSSSERLVRLVNDVLVFNRLENEQTPLEVRPVNLWNVVQDAVDTMQALAHSQCQMIEAEADSVEIMIDNDRIHQVLINLVQNALKFSPSLSKVRVAAHVVDERIEFEVADEGRGIPEANIESIFEPFFQVDGSDARMHSGTGLGLAICRGIVELHGGCIWAENREPRGTSVRIRIPLIRSVTQPLLEMVAS